MKEKRREMKENMIWLKNVSEHPNPPDELSQNVSNKPISDVFFSNFFHRKFINYVHDSNSIFRFVGTNPEKVIGRTVRDCPLLVISLADQGTQAVRCSFHGGWGQEVALRGRRAWTNGARWSTLATQESRGPCESRSKGSNSSHTRAGANQNHNGT